MFNTSLSDIIVRVPALLIAFAFHEWAHAAMADHFGDPTPRNQGRLSLNPFVHLDIIGTLMVLMANFGWAKPVQTNPAYYRGNKRRADLMVSVAGVAMNFLIAFVVLIIYKLVYYFTGGDSYSRQLLSVLDEIVVLNIILGIFNLFPIPPLDGFHVLADILPEELAANLYRFEQYGTLLLLLIILTPVASYILGPVFGVILNFFDLVTNGLLGLFGVG